MSYSYERRQRRQTYGATGQRTAWGYWIPLAVTVTIATAGLAAWIWSERKDDEDDYPPGSPPPGYGNAPASNYGPPGPSTGPDSMPPGQYGPPPPGFPSAPPSSFGGPPPGQPPYAPGLGPDNRGVEEESMVSRMSGALRRTPSPQQIIDGASRRVVAGVAAAGAAVGGALTSITEEDKKDYEDHSRWSEEADSQNGASRKGPELRDAEASKVVSRAQASTTGASKKKTVAIVISAETDYEHAEDATYHSEHAVCLYFPLRLSHCLPSFSQYYHIFLGMSTKNRAFSFSSTTRNSSGIPCRLRLARRLSQWAPRTPTLAMKTLKVAAKQAQTLMHLHDPRCSTRSSRKPGISSNTRH